MNKIVVFISIICFSQATIFAQRTLQINGKEVYKGEDVVFHKIDDHTWVGSGKEMFNESLYLVEGKILAVLIDAGTSIKNLDKIIASITPKPVMLVATHVHPDHTGPSINCFEDIYINPADTLGIPMFMPDYQGKINYLKDGQIIEMGGRQLEVLFTPGHTPGSTTFIDKDSHYGFSGDSFGGGYLLLFTNFPTLKYSCEKTSAIMKAYGINVLYPGHYTGSNLETKQRVDDLQKISEDILSGKIQGEQNPDDRRRLKLMIRQNGVQVSFSENALN